MVILEGFLYKNTWEGSKFLAHNAGYIIHSAYRSTEYTVQSTCKEYCTEYKVQNT